MPAQNPVSFISANLVAQPVGFHMSRGWGQGDEAVQDLFRPVQHFADRFDFLVSEVRALGFTSIDLWCAHLHPAWATVRHLEIARAVLDRHQVKITSYASHWGSNLEDLRCLKHVLSALGTDLISGNHGLLASDRPALVAALRDLKLRLAFENHPEKSSAEMLAKIGPDATDVLGIAYDTGWAGTQGFDAVAALPGLLPRLFHIHAKDVKARRTEKTGFQLIDMGHETCVLGDGVVGIEKVIRAAVAGGFTGPIGVEHEPEDFNPMADCRESLRRVRSWLA
jgi:sugar phosphate isomerase/epimerase